jgi:predicted NUDIX family phosphoesterase
MRREIEEETSGYPLVVVNDATDKIAGFTPLHMDEFKGIIYSTRQPVDEVHLGLLFVFDMSRIPQASMRNGIISTQSEFAVHGTPHVFMPISEALTLNKIFSVFETWSEIVLENY